MAASSSSTPPPPKAKRRRKKGQAAQEPKQQQVPAPTICDDMDWDDPVLGPLQEILLGLPSRRAAEQLRECRTSVYPCRSDRQLAGITFPATNKSSGWRHLRLEKLRNNDNMDFTTGSHFLNHTARQACREGLPGSDAVRAASELDADVTIVSLDGRSAYDRVSRAAFLTKLREVAPPRICGGMPGPAPRDLAMWTAVSREMP